MTDRFIGARLYTEIQMQEGETRVNKDSMITKHSTKQRTFTSSQHVPSRLVRNTHVHSHLFESLAKKSRHSMHCALIWAELFYVKFFGYLVILIPQGIVFVSLSALTMTLNFLFECDWSKRTCNWITFRRYSALGKIRDQKGLCVHMWIILIFIISGIFLHIKSN